LLEHGRDISYASFVYFIISPRLFLLDRLYKSKIVTLWKSGSQELS